MATESELATLSASVDSLIATVADLLTELRDQHVFAERSRTLIRRQWLLTGALLLVGLGVAVVAVVAIRTARVAQTNSARAVSQCGASNNARAVTLNTWNTVLSADFTSYLPPDQRQAAADRLAGLRANLAKVLVQQDCSKLK